MTNFNKTRSLCDKDRAPLSLVPIFLVEELILLAQKRFLHIKKKTKLTSPNQIGKDP